MDTNSDAGHDLLQMLPRLPLAAAVCAGDAAGSIVSVSDLFVRTFGYRLDDIPTMRDWWLRVCPDDRDRRQACSAYDAAVAKARAAGGGSEPLEFRVACGDGTVRDIVLGVSVVGRFLMMAFTDVTRHKETERRLQAVTERMRLAAVAAGMGFWTRDLETEIEDWDEQMLDLYGVSRAEFDGRWEPFLHPDDRERARDEAQRAIDEGRYGDYAFRIVRPDGTIRHLRGMSQVIRDAHGRPTLDLGVDIDITRQVEAEAALAAARDQERRHAEAHRRNLEQKLKTSLNAAAIAHEINQPLSRVILRARMGLEAATGADRDTLAALVADAERVVAVIEKMKMLLRNVETAHREVDLTAVAASAIHQVKRPLRAAGVTLVRRGTERGCLVLGDDVQLQMLVINLLSNAIEAIGAMPGGRREIVVEQHARDGSVELVIGDSGPGWPGGTLDEMLLNSTKAGGAGLGLYVVKTAVDNHRGRLTIGRSPLGGAEFRIGFPPAGRPEHGTKLQSGSAKIPSALGSDP